MDMSGHVSTPVPVAFIPQTHKQLREESGQGAGRGAEGGALRGAGEGRRVSDGCSCCQVGRARSRIHALIRIYPRPLLLRLFLHIGDRSKTDHPNQSHPLHPHLTTTTTPPTYLHTCRLLAETGGPYLAGEHISLDDMALAPKLYHVKVGR